MTQQSTASGAVARAPFTTYDESVRLVLEQAGIAPLFAKQRRVLLKPNLVNTSPFPVTTPPAMCAALIDAIREMSDCEILIAEGSGDMARETPEVFAALGYSAMAGEKGVALLDLNHAPLRVLRDPSRSVFPEMHLPEILFDSFVVSVPVLKVHSMSGITGALKNMVGVAPPEHYGGRHGVWKKAVFHNRMQQSILDLCHYRSPDFSVMEGSVGLASFHLGGPLLDPPAGVILAAQDGRELDRVAAGLLGLDWRQIGHLC